MCAVAMDRADLNKNGGRGRGGVRGLGATGIWRRGAKMVGSAGGVAIGGGGERGGGAGGLEDSSRKMITQLHKDVTKLQWNAWQVGGWQEEAGG